MHSRAETEMDPKRSISQYCNVAAGADFWQKTTTYTNIYPDRLFLITPTANRKSRKNKNDTTDQPARANTIAIKIKTNNASFVRDQINKTIIAKLTK